MLIYSHSTPEILIASFRNKEQVKNSSYCGLIDENFPDDVMTLAGDDLVIKEPAGTLNIDIALAIAFNSIRTCDDARQFAMLYTINGPNVDTKTLMYYKTRIINGPFGSCVREFIDANFEAARNGVTGVNVSNIQRDLGGSNIRNISTRDSFEPSVGTNRALNNDFISTLKKSFGDCLNAPCNYFAHGGSYGFLTNGAGANSTNAIGYNEQLGFPIHDNETFSKMPQIFQKMSVTLSQMGTNTLTNVKNVFTTKEQKAKEQDVIDKGKVTKENNNTANSSGVFNFDLTSFFNFSKAASQVQSAIANSLGDCFRMEDYRKRYNPYSYLETGGMNGETAAEAGATTGIPTTQPTLTNKDISVSAPFTEETLILPTPGDVSPNLLLPSATPITPTVIQPDLSIQPLRGN
jgi:hypothetical protein